MSESEVDKKIKDLFKNEIEIIRLRSFRAAKMEYQQASIYDIWLEQLEILFFVLIFVGAAVGLYDQSLVEGTILALPGIIVAIFDSVNKLYCTNKSQVFVPIMRARAISHNNAAAKWQWLQQTAESHLIMLNKPGIPVEEVKQWHAELCHERKKICANVTVHEDVYRSFNEKERFPAMLLAYNNINKSLKELLPSLEIGAEQPRDIEIDKKEPKCFNKKCKCFCKWIMFSWWSWQFLIRFLVLLCACQIVWGICKLGPVNYFLTYWNYMIHLVKVETATNQTSPV